MNLKPLTYKDKLKLASDWVSARHPIMVGAVLANWQVIADPTVKTAETDGKCLWYNPAFFDRLSLAAVKCVMLHEPAHPLLGHQFRLEGRDGELFNIAADLAINSQLKSEYEAAFAEHGQDPEGFLGAACFPGTGKFAHLPDGKSAEWYYNALVSERDKPKPDNGAGSTDGNGNGTSTGNVAQDNSNSGNGGGGQPENPFGKLRPAPVDKLGHEGEGKRDWENTVARTILTCGEKGLGDGFRGLVEQLQGELNPQSDAAFEINWKAALRQFLTRVTRGGATYSRPNRRHSWRSDVILPCNRTKGASRGLIVVDTSASMSLADCDMAFREAESVLRAYPKTTIKLLMCDVAVYESRVLTAADFPIREHHAWMGRGGTDLTPALRWARAYRPDWLIVVSDMDWSYRSAPNPGCPVFWLDTDGACAKHYGQPPFGTLVPLKKTVV
jgi:predicted metal-dependent peptidase